MTANIHNNLREIIVTESNANKRGDLFNRLTFDVLHALGFEKPQFDVQMIGREIDMIAPHRTENRVAIVESKSQEDKIGGADLNKFYGALDVEAGVYENKNVQTVGYFLSRTGFTATALQQEKERRGHRELILMGPSEIVAELIRGKMLCSLERAAEITAADKSPDLQLCEKADLVASEDGWVWVLYYSACPQQAATHFAFVHADGNRLLNDLANKLIEKTRATHCAFSNLTYIPAPPNPSEEKIAAQTAYFRYLQNELGEIRFEGMPADKEAGAVRVRLENIFTPLHFVYDKKTTTDRKILYSQRATVKNILDGKVRAAVLAKPGGGKSTLIRRIALAYAFPERRKQVDDGLPDREFFPVYIRCRDLGNDAQKSIQEIIGEIVNRAEITQHAHAFKLLTDDALQAGRVLLLIDGLDEISNEQHRISFVDKLRTFTATYPSVHLIVTSREAGFRSVAGTLTSYCMQYIIAPLRQKEISGLCLKWHEAILGRSRATEIEANKVCKVILEDKRIVALAENPLLLTTLLFVKRWVGYLPTKKCHLYAEMIKLLLVTWNAVAHEKLDIDETEPQLAFVAYRMTLDGQQKITRSKLTEYVIAARKELPDILSYIDISPSKFIDRVEERSSLLIQYGLEEDENGHLVPSYEFSHLSFQEYLTAMAVTQNWIPDADRTLLEILQPHWQEEQWREVIPMAAVLAGRRAKPIIENLIACCEQNDPSYDSYFQRPYTNSTQDFAAMHICNCIAAEVPMSADMLEKAVLIAVKKKSAVNNIIINSKTHQQSYIFYNILKSKYGETYRNIVQRELFAYSDDNHIYSFADTWIDIYRAENEKPLCLKNIASLFASDDPKTNIGGALLLLQFAFESIGKNDCDSRPNAQTLQTIFGKLSCMLDATDNTTLFAATWCLAWSGYNEADLLPHDLLSTVYTKLMWLWQQNDLQPKIRRNVSWAIYNCSMLSLQNKFDKQLFPPKDVILQRFAKPQNDFDKRTALFLGILTEVWPQSAVQQYIREADDKNGTFSKMPPFLQDCGYELPQITIRRKKK
ncbi:MAG: NACHT domain-containing protein [Clostridia bacterium]|nr:NACHT domain-containing protein [Clostridia bacterium]